MVRFFLLEKHIDIPRYQIDLLLGENRDEEFLKLNPSGQTPALELEDGTILAEAPAICEYVEEACQEPVLIGETPLQRAITRMWWRRVELNICQPMIMGYYFGEGLELFRTRTRCIPQAAEGMKERARDGMRWLNALLTDEWIVGPRFSIADMCLYGYLDELADKGQPLPEDCTNVRRWFKAVSTRSTADRSVWRLTRSA
ncbi:glutathione S-transferase family protein [Sphingomonas limnosediminicola]|uniref:Glutathione S-transferase family protein n=2 Tax=Sphingomonas limnosediminicola TaxID=940133 RepID=A0ABP7LZ69_9SPHN